MYVSKEKLVKEQYLVSHGPLVTDLDFTWTFVLCVSGFEGGRGWLPVWGGPPDWRHCRNDTQLLWLRPPQPEQRGVTPRHLSEAVLDPCFRRPACPGYDKAVAPWVQTLLEQGRDPASLQGRERESCQPLMDWELHSDSSPDDPHRTLGWYGSK